MRVALAEHINLSSSGQLRGVWKRGVKRKLVKIIGGPTVVWPPKKEISCL
jgi:hypothetical protein